MQEGNDSASLREKAKKCRRLADQITDQQTIDTLRNMADEYEAKAAAIDAQTSAGPPLDMPPAT